MIKISFAELAAARKGSGKFDTIIVAVGEDRKLAAGARDLLKDSAGLVDKALSSGKFKGKRGQCVSVVLPKEASFDRLVLVGLGDTKSLDELAWQKIGSSVVPHLNDQASKAAAFHVDEKKGVAAAHIAYGAILRSYRFDKYFTTKKPEEKPTLQSLTVLCASPKDAQKAYEPLEALADSIRFTRDIVTEPANVIYPASLADKCKELSKIGVDVEVLGEAQMRKLGMNALLGVGQGSANESKLVVMQWNGLYGKGKKAEPLAFVGKGVTFDTGGISIKPAGGMEEMKWDMGGSAAVIGLMRTLALRKAKVNVVGVVGLVENMPDGKAQRPGDVVTSMSGQTIEVINTDAEGRLVLSDALWYTQKKFKPRFVIDLATLTGAIIISLGSSRAGLFSNDDKLSDQLFQSGKKSGEEVWRLPLGDVYDKQINSPIADMQNVGEGREAGSITAAQFLQRFIEKGTPWAHLDIAGVAWTKKDLDGVPKGATAFGVRLLDRLIADYYEGK